MAWASLGHRLCVALAALGHRFGHRLCIALTVLGHRLSIVWASLVYRLGDGDGDRDGAGDGDGDCDGDGDGGLVSRVWF